MNRIYTGGVHIEKNLDYYRIAPANNIMLNSSGDVTVGVNHGHNPFASANNTKKILDRNVTFELNHGHNTFASANTEIKNSDVNVAIKANYDDNPSTFANTTMKHLDDVTNKINHDHYRFAYDLVETVLEIRMELNPNVPRNLPEPPNYLFTKEHENMVKSYLKSDTTYLLQTIYKLSNGVYDWNNYEKCRDFLVEKWQDLDYSENSFIGGCASIAYTAAHFIQGNYHCGALDNAVQYIASWIDFVLKNGTIDQSCW